MENDGNLVKNKKCANKAKSQCSGPPKIKNEHMKRKSFNVNDTVQSLDLAFGRLKKSKLVNGEHCISTPVSPTRAWGTDTFPGYSSSQFPQGPDSNSLMSMNFSHYELIRNLSRSNCNSECAFSGSTCNAKLNTSDPTVKSEHLERYFRSAEIWTRNLKRAGPSAVRFGIPDK